jgi:alpha-L-fucosidase
MVDPSRGPDLEWWQNARFGMFIHWGLYSLLGRGEWVMYQEHVPLNEYASLADRFKADAYDPSEWVALARDAGMKYMVITTRHHDGFCLYDSEVSDFTAPKSAAGRDLVGDFVDACRSEGMRIGFYYSLVDWRFPGVLPRTENRERVKLEPMVEQAHAQVRELCTKYGKIDILWFDMMDPHDTVLWRSHDLVRMARDLQPRMLVNDRAGLGGDFATPENVVNPRKGPWESCYTMNRTWGYARYDRNYRSTSELLRLLASCVSQNGNLLLNVGPDGRGRVPIEAVERLREIGVWLRGKGEAIYGCGPSPIDAPALGVATRRNGKVYLILQRWPGSTLSLAWCGSPVRSARLLPGERGARVAQEGDRVWISGLPEYPPDPHLNAVELRFDGEPRPTDPPYS